MITNKFVITAESFKYTDYRSVSGKYKGKQYKIVVRIKADRSTAQGFLLTTQGYVELFYESDFTENVHDYSISSKSNIEDKLKVLQIRVEQAIAFIEKVY